MSDQQRWFKLWVTAPHDEHLVRLSVADRWAWAVLGCYTKVHGTRGTVTLSESNVVLAASMGIPVTELFSTLRRLPHITVQNCEHGEVTVTWKNWVKFQEDSTQAERQRTSRSKKRREENIKAVPPNPQSVAPATVTDSNGHQPDGSSRHEANKAAARELLKQVTERLDKKEPNAGNW